MSNSKRNKKTNHKPQHSTLTFPDGFIYDFDDGVAVNSNGAEVKGDLRFILAVIASLTYGRFVKINKNAFAITAPDIDPDKALPIFKLGSKKGGAWSELFHRLFADYADNIIRVER